MKKYFGTYIILYVVGWLLSINGLIFDYNCENLGREIFNNYLEDVDGEISDYLLLSDIFAKTIAVPVDIYLDTIQDNLVLFVTCSEYDIYHYF